MRRPSVIAALLALACSGAPAETGTPPSRMQALLASVEAEPRPPELDALLAPWIRKDMQEQARNLVLNEMEAASAAFAAGYFRHAEVLFSDAQQQIETIYADNPAAASARSNFVPESTKDFKGDPYERAMVGFYLGLIDLARGDHDNARAGFRFAQLQDTMSASETYQDDMALMQYLIGWADWCEDHQQSAKEAFARAQAMRSGLTPPAAGHNLLLIAEMGRAPVKTTGGRYGELLSYRAGPAVPEQQVAFAYGDRQLAGQLAEDLHFQASTRGGTAVDSIRAGKASFRQGAETVANTAAGVGKLALGASVLSNGRKSRDMLAVSLVAGLASVVSDSVARNTQTTADARAWGSLPATVHLATGRLDDPQAVIEAAFFGSDGRPLKSQTMLKKTAAGRCSLAFVRATGQPGEWASADGSKWRAMPPLGLAEAAPRTGDTTSTAAAPVPISDEGARLLDRIRMMRENPAAPPRH